jgi:CRP-like cAMP-binding protein
VTRRCAKPTVNRLLAVLSRAERTRLLASCDAVDLVLGNVLCKPGARMEHAYFPIDSFVSLLIPIDGHPDLEVALVGDEGMLGVSLALGLDTSPLQALVQGAGTAWRIKAADLRRELGRNPNLTRALNRYIYVMLNQLALVAACIRFHRVEARLARWLLLTADRAHSDQFDVTHELLSHMLGVRRVGVTRAASALRERNLIRYHRGHVTILERRGLETASCACYGAANRLYEQVLGSSGANQIVPPTAYGARRAGVFLNRAG